MKVLAALPLAAVLAFGAATTAHAFNVPSDYLPDDRAATMQSYAGDVIVGERPHHPCHGMTSGTHHRSCGSATGGPAGGLF